MRLGINDDLGHRDPEEWIGILKRLGLRTAAAPMAADGPESVKKDYMRLAEENDIVFGEVGVWKNVLDPDMPVFAEHLQGMAEYEKAIAFMKKQEVI